MTEMTKPLIVDKSKIVIPKGTIEDYQRANHPDFMDASELKKIEFTGTRHNSLNDDCEIWMLGEIVKRVSPTEVVINPNAINEAYEEVFCLGEVRPYDKKLIEYRKKQQ